MSARTSIYIDGFRHRNPVPNAARIGSLVMTGLILGTDPSTNKPVADEDGQVAYMFQHVRSVIEAAGGKIDDILKFTVWLKNPRDRAILNKHWIEMFPDPLTRPARHVQPLLGLPEEYLIGCDFTAVLN